MFCNLQLNKSGGGPYGIPAAIFLSTFAKNHGRKPVDEYEEDNPPKPCTKEDMLRWIPQTHKILWTCQ